jgi:hypothetical protein
MAKQNPSHNGQQYIKGEVREDPPEEGCLGHGLENNLHEKIGLGLVGAGFVPDPGGGKLEPAPGFSFLQKTGCSFCIRNACVEHEV